MRKSSALITATIAASVLLLPDSTSQATAAYVMNFGTVAPDGTPWSAQLVDIKKRIEAESGGRVKVKLFLGGSLGSEMEMVQDVARGERLQGGGFSTGAIGSSLDIPILLLPELPYLFRSNDEADKILDDVLLGPTSAALADKGFMFGAWAENGWRSFATKGGAANTPETLQKFKMRCQESPVHQDMYAALGVQAVAKPTSEVLPALNTGIVDGFDNTPLFSLASGWIEPATHYTLSRHIYQPAAVLYSKSFYDALPTDLQTLVLGDPMEESVRGRVGVRALEAELLQTIGEMGKEVVELSADEQKAFRQLTRPVHKQFLASHSDMVPIYKEVQSTLRALRQ